MTEDQMWIAFKRHKLVQQFGEEHLLKSPEALKPRDESFLKEQGWVEDTFSPPKTAWVKGRKKIHWVPSGEVFVISEAGTWLEGMFTSVSDALAGFNRESEK
ncbi:hypothetical protein ACQ4M3_09805 [Leptolyngbya sp. AN03gr2]|uniref:hypothetical protein n=1 Tax=Leptolyngbya sp. AN03gr2 TaxID=3423364 RepID=UPI003D31F76E